MSVAEAAAGGDRLEHQPRDLNVVDYVKERANEISDLLAVVDNDALAVGEVTQGPRTVMQRLARHLRRRAMSHNVKRLPTRMRAFAAKHMTHTSHRKKPPSRYYRRRPSCLLKAYIRRQRKHRWLETHIWHAKRFHMVDRWGYRLAERSYQKGFRPSYRDAVRHCLVADVSYYRTFELVGTQQHITTGLKKLCGSASVGLSPAYCEAVAGRQSITSVFYQPDSYPHGCIGPVETLWNPHSAVNGAPNVDSRQLWLTVHPAIRDQIQAALIDVFDLAPSTVRPMSDDDLLPKENPAGPEPASVDEWRRQRLGTEPSWLGGTDTTAVCLTDLRDRLARFRLVGPESLPVLAKCLSAADTMVPSVDLQSLHQFQLQDGQVVNFLTKDPRVFQSRIKSKPKRKADVGSGVNNVADHLLSSAPFPLWSRAQREECLRKKLPDYKLNEMRQSMATMDASFEPSTVPVLLIARSPAASKSEQSRLGIGWEMIVPLGWAMPFWIALQYSTAHAIGLREELNLRRETGRFLFPDHYPDSEAGRRSAEEAAVEAKKHMQKRPWNKRPNYCRLKIDHPHHLPWQLLVQDWWCYSEEDAGEDSKQCAANVFIMRDRRHLTTVRRWLKRKESATECEAAEKLIKDYPTCLVPVVVTSIERGTPKPNSLMCIPNDIDWAEMTSTKSQIMEPITRRSVQTSAPPAATSSTSDMTGFVSLSDETELNIADLFPDTDRLKMQRRKTNEKAKRKRSKSKGPPKVTATDGRTTDVLANGVDEQRRQYQVIEGCSRKIIGYSVAGGFSLSTGRGRSIGYCSLVGLKVLLNAAASVGRKPSILFRNTSSAVYSWAFIDVL